jgi:hypothetical protein
MLKNIEPPPQNLRTITPVQASLNLEQWREDYLAFLERENPIELESKARQSVSGWRFRSVPQHSNN